MSVKDEENKEITNLIDGDGLLENEDLLRYFIEEDEVIANRHRVLILLRFFGVIGEERPSWRGRRRCRPRTNRHLARDYASWLLEGDDDMFKHLFRMPQALFRDLCRWLRINTSARDSRQISLEQKLMIVLWIFAYGEPQRNTAFRFCVSQGTVSNIFHELLEPLRRLHIRFVMQPTSHLLDLSAFVELSPKMTAFNGAVGAIDGCHIPAYVPRRHQKRYWSRKNNISQNILAAVNFEGFFVYVLVGAEGSINDSSLIRIAKTIDLRIPSARFFIADAGFGSSRGILIPFPETRYHLKDWEAADRRPQNKKEIYNLRHARLRVIVEQIFGRVKRKFKIVRHSAAEYDIRDQQRIILAVTGLWNFILGDGLEPNERDLDLQTYLNNFPHARAAMEAAKRRADDFVPAQTPRGLRAAIAGATWQRYNEVLRIRREKEEEEARNHRRHRGNRGEEAIEIRGSGESEESEGGEEIE